LPSVAEQLVVTGPIRLLSLCVASWLRFLSGIDEQGQAIPLEEPNSKYLQAVAARCAQARNINEFVVLHDIFGDLFTAYGGRFKQEVEKHFINLWQKGALATLTEVVQT
jgi:mannitol-1-phosphate/altronate dehydrogenase